MSSSDDSSLSAPPQRTALYALHCELQAKLVPFAGYLLPLQFTRGIKAEHLHTRAHAGLFDVSHMGQIFIRGGGAARALERLVTGDMCVLQDFQQRYTLLTNAQGGIIDDLMVTKLPEGLFLVVNAACKDQDYAYIKAALGGECQVEMWDRRALLALQGPAAAAVLGAMNTEIVELGFMRGGRFNVAGIDCRINRCGYTGEDGFELSVDNDNAIKLAESLLAHDAVQAVGLGARDSLRLEAGLCLYGHDIDGSTTPVEAQLQWTIAKKYRDGSAVADFPGADTIRQQLQQGTDRRLVGLQPEGKMPVRAGTVIFNDKKFALGQVTSGGYGPSFGRPVAMGYVATDCAAVGTEIEVEIRHRSHTMRITELPFVEHRYFKS